MQVQKNLYNFLKFIERKTKKDIFAVEHPLFESKQFLSFSVNIFHQRKLQSLLIHSTGTSFETIFALKREYY